MKSLAAVVLIAVAVELWHPSPRRLVAARLGEGVRRWRIRRVRPVVLMPAAVVVALVVDGPIALVASALFLAVMWGVELALRSRRRAAAAKQRRELVDSLAFLVSELRAGSVPELALASVAAESPVLVPAARAAARGVSVLSVLRATAVAEPGAEPLALVGAAWQVAERSGAPIAEALDRIVERIRDDLELDREVDAELAPARATARVMAILPVVGLGLGSGIGGDPIGVVTGTWVGAICATIGIGLAVLGLAWMERVASGVTR